MTSGLLVTRQLPSDLYEYFATSFLIVLVLRIVKGSVSTFVLAQREMEKWRCLLV
jgi:hypothetical protein